MIHPTAGPVNGEICQWRNLSRCDLSVRGGAPVASHRDGPAGSDWWPGPRAPWRRRGDTLARGMIGGLSRRSGPVAQLGARLNGIQEVTGSIPVRSTTPRSARVPPGFQSDARWLGRARRAVFAYGLVNPPLQASPESLRRSAAQPTSPVTVRGRGSASGADPRPLPSRGRRKRSGPRLGRPVGTGPST